MRKYVRLVPYLLAVLLLSCVVLYLLGTTSEKESTQTRVKDSVVPWEKEGVANVKVGVVDSQTDSMSVDDTLLSKNRVNEQFGHARRRRNIDPISPIQTSRHVALDYECQSRNTTTSWRSLSKELRQIVAQRMVVNDQYKLMYCAVPLLSLGPWMKVLYYITPQASSLTDISKVPGKELGQRKNFVYLNSFTLEEQEKRLESYLSFMVSRHPFQRLAIAYKLKFDGSNAFFNDRYGKEIVKKYRRGSTGESVGDDVKFTEFAQYVSETKTKDMNEHWQPLESLCQPCAVDYDIILHHETMERDAQELIATAQLTDRVHKFPYDRWDNVEMSYVHKLFEQLTPALVGKMVKMYRGDFGLFSYSSL